MVILTEQLMEPSKDMLMVSLMDTNLANNLEMLMEPKLDPWLDR